MGDQLSRSISSLRDIDPEKDLILMCEVMAECNYVKHHKKKIAFLFSAMRHFAAELTEGGYKVHYTKIDDPENTGSFAGEVHRLTKLYGARKIILTEPSEYRVLEEVKNWQQNIPIDVRPDNRFLCSREYFTKWANGRQQLRMEFFYREMRKKYGVLMENNKPIGGQWNFDSENRKPPKSGLSIPPTYTCKPDAISRDVIASVNTLFKDHFGDIEPFHFAVTRNEALQALDKFIGERLNQFGHYQDAMLQNEPWMFHSHLSFYINCGLLLPMECIEKAENAYREGRAPLNAVEGFIRQILGWREFIRGIYWLKMPNYEQQNFLSAKKSLPEFYWSGNTKMNCLKQCITETKQNAYAHHIQRLMVLGNFLLLTGVDPQAVNEWYLIVYADAYHWVELPNVSGMILFADGGLLGSKPYAASGSYINKMSNYCKGCEYRVAQKNGPEACPFNYLYWHFLIKNQTKLQDNPRLAMPYRSLQKMSEEKQSAIKSDAKIFLRQLDSNETV